MNELYRTSDGCRSLLTSVLRHRGCGASILEASPVARDPQTDRAAGFAVVTETSSRKAHLAQLAVAPDYQGRGLGRRILFRVIERLSDMGYDGLSSWSAGTTTGPRPLSIDGLRAGDRFSGVLPGLAASRSAIVASLAYWVASR